MSPKHFLNIVPIYFITSPRPPEGSRPGLPRSWESSKTAAWRCLPWNLCVEERRRHSPLDRRPCAMHAEQWIDIFFCSSSAASKLTYCYTWLSLLLYLFCTPYFLGWAGRKHSEVRSGKPMAFFVSWWKKNARTHRKLTEAIRKNELQTHKFHTRNRYFIVLIGSSFTGRGRAHNAKIFSFSIIWGRDHSVCTRFRLLQTWRAFGCSIIVVQ